MFHVALMHFFMLAWLSWGTRLETVHLLSVSGKTSGKHLMQHARLKRLATSLEEATPSTRRA